MSVIIYFLLSITIPLLFPIFSTRWCFDLLDTDLVWVQTIASMAIGFSTAVFSSSLVIATPALFNRFERSDDIQSFQLGLGCVSLIICGTLSLFVSGFTAGVLSKSVY